MKFKKQIGIIISCITILAVVFFAVSYIGNKEKNVSKNNNPDNVETGSTSTDNDNLEESNNTSVDKSATKGNTENGQQEETSKSNEGIKEGYYTVKETDTLYSIARTYMPNSDPTEVVEAIKERNEIADNVISKGQKLIISYETALENKNNESSEANNNDHTNHSKYTVKDGDTLFKIAEQYMSSMNVMDAIEAIKAHNNMGDSTVIKVDQSICIPAIEQ